jgi:hypothetical protein
MYVLFFLILFPLSSFADENCRILQVDELSGTVEALSISNERIELSNGDSIEVGETIVTGADSWVDLLFCDGGVQRISELSDLLLLKPMFLGFYAMELWFVKGSNHRNH